jgi:hypothetical protein
MDVSMLSISMASAKGTGANTRAPWRMVIQWATVAVAWEIQRQRRGAFEGGDAGATV